MKAHVKLELKDYKDEVYKCVRCGYCRETVHSSKGIWRVCPIREFAPELGGFESTVARGRMLQARYVLEGTLKIDEGMVKHLYACMVCGACKAVCPAEADTAGIYEALRAEAVEAGIGPLTGQKKWIRNLAGEHNPYMEKHEDRTNWMPKGFNLPEKADTVYFVGCTLSYREKEVAESTVRLLQKAEVTFTVMGDEWCCGSVTLRTGQLAVIPELVEHNVEAFKKAGANRILTSCAGCYRTIKVDYPKLEVDFEKMGFKVIHTSELIAELLKERKLPLKALNLRVTYHDPCHLGRHSNLYDVPRKVIAAIPGVEFVEMPRKREYALCCGAGGGVKSGYPEISVRIANERVKEAEQTGAKILLSTCPFCRRNLKDAIAQYESKIEMLDLTELLARAI